MRPGSIEVCRDFQVAVTTPALPRPGATTSAFRYPCSGRFGSRLVAVVATTVTALFHSWLVNFAKLQHAAFI